MNTKWFDRKISQVHIMIGKLKIMVINWDATLFSLMDFFLNKVKFLKLFDLYHSTKSSVHKHYLETLPTFWPHWKYIVCYKHICKVMNSNTSYFVTCFIYKQHQIHCPICRYKQFYIEILIYKHFSLLMNDLNQGEKSKSQ